MLPSSSSASPARAIIRPGGASVGTSCFEPQVILRHRGEQGHADAEPDRAGREIDGFAVLGARRVGLRAAKGAKPLQLLAALMPEQVLDGVEDRRGVRLDRDAVLWAQHVEIERGHQCRHRGARRLVAADLQPVAVRAKVVGVVDHPGRQPQHLALERRQAGDLVLRRRFFLYADCAFQDLRHFHLLLPGGSLADSRLKICHLTECGPRAYICSESREWEHR